MKIGLIETWVVGVHVCVCVCGILMNAAYHNEKGCSWIEDPGLTLLKVISANAMVLPSAEIVYTCLDN